MWTFEHSNSILNVLLSELLMELIYLANYTQKEEFKTEKSPKTDKKDNDPTRKRVHVTLVSIRWATEAPQKVNSPL